MIGCSNTFALEAGKEYRLSLYARQYSNSSGAFLQAGIGSTAISDSMKNCHHPLFPCQERSLSVVHRHFHSVGKTVRMLLGIQGRGSSSNHLSIDDIRLTENAPHTIQNDKSRVRYDYAQQDPSNVRRHYPTEPHYGRGRDIHTLYDQYYTAVAQRLLLQNAR